MMQVNIRKKIEDIITDPIDNEGWNIYIYIYIYIYIHTHPHIHYEKLYAYKFDNLDEVD